ncbi:hypothetical protein J6590_050803 [Homalodisca vitripennis]|nr:hypothetical protein J6590_050803 [Homalodisca vitripennis]
MPTVITKEGAAGVGPFGRRTHRPSSFQHRPCRLTATVVSSLICTENENIAPHKKAKLLRRFEISERPADSK